MARQQAPEGQSALTGARRAIPVREVPLPHHCPRPVRMSVLARAAYFRGLGERELDSIDRRMQAVSWAAGDHLYHAGDPADSLHVVAQGRVKLSRVTPEGTETISDILVPGELFGAMSSLGEPFHEQSASALVGTCTLRIGQADFREVLATLPRVGLRVLDDVAARLVRAQFDIGGQSTHTVPERTATALLRLADKLGEDRGPEGILLEVPLSRSDLAGLARSTPESVSRVMSRWKKEGIIDSGRRWTALLDRQRLEDVAAGNGS